MFRAFCKLRIESQNLSSVLCEVKLSQLPLTLWKCSNRSTQFHSRSVVMSCLFVQTEKKEECVYEVCLPPEESSVKETESEENIIKKKGVGAMVKIFHFIMKQSYIGALISMMVSNVESQCLVLLNNMNEILKVYILLTLSFLLVLLKCACCLYEQINLTFKFYIQRVTGPNPQTWWKNVVCKTLLPARSTSMPLSKALNLFLLQWNYWLASSRKLWLYWAASMVACVAECNQKWASVLSLDIPGVIFFFSFTEIQVALLFVKLLSCHDSICCSKISTYLSELMAPSQNCKLAFPKALTQLQTLLVTICPLLWSAQPDFTKRDQKYWFV